MVTGHLGGAEQRAALFGGSSGTGIAFADETSLSAFAEIDSAIGEWVFEDLVAIFVKTVWGCVYEEDLDAHDWGTFLAGLTFEEEQSEGRLDSAEMPEPNDIDDCELENAEETSQCAKSIWEIENDTDAFNARETVFKLVALALDRDPRLFGERYCAGLSSIRDTCLSSLDCDRLGAELLKIYESVASLGNRLPGIPELRLDRSLIRRAISISEGFRDPSIALVPALYFALLPFWPISAGNRLRGLLFSTTGPEPVSVSDVAARLSNAGITVRLGYLEWWMRNDERLVTLRKEHKLYVVRVQEVFSDFVNASHGIPRESYCSLDLNKLRYRPIAWLPPIRLHQDIELRTDIVVKYWASRQRVFEGFSVDWDEVAGKMLCESFHQESLRQGLRGSLHAAIVSALLKSGRAMSREELSTAFGFEVAIDPVQLSPGRLLAYSRHKRFLDADSAFYVLKDWVATETNQRGLIAQDRIATPLREKNVAFSKEQFFKSLDGDPVFMAYRLIAVDGVAKRIARTLPDLPVEPYYINEIKKKCEQYLLYWAEPVGTDFYLPRDVFLERAPEMTFYDWRKQLLERLIDRVVDVRGYVESIEDSYIREHLARFVGFRLSS